jgi:hypothetical protein
MVTIVMNLGQTIEGEKVTCNPGFKITPCNEHFMTLKGVYHMRGFSIDNSIWKVKGKLLLLAR